VDLKTLAVEQVSSSQSVYFRDLSVTVQKLYLHRSKCLVKKYGVTERAKLCEEVRGLRFEV
jgi:hypothetical protein